MMTVPVVPAVFPADVMAVNPTMSVRYVAGHPNHFVVARPIPRAMIVKWPVANLDFDALRSNSGRQKDAGRNDSDEKKFVFDHYPNDHRRTAVANALLVGGNTS